MKLHKLPLFLVLALPLSAYTSYSHAECARGDIDYYLDKGFTPDQITAICTTAPTNTTAPVTDHSDAQPAESLNNEGTTGNTLMTTPQQTSLGKNEQFLKKAINGRNVVLTDDSLQYSLKTCYNYGEEDQYGFAPEACPIVKFVIALNGLEVIQSGKKYIFFGDHEIKVKGAIRREIIGGLEEHKAEEQQQIQKHLESGNQTIIPIRDDISLADVKQVFLQLSR